MSQLTTVDLYTAVMCDHNEYPDEACPFCSARFDFPQSVEDMQRMLDGDQEPADER